jgi:Uma2 family endonuclease
MNKMSETLEKVKFYYDEHPTKEDLMGENARQFMVCHYLVSLLRWYLRFEKCFVIGNLNIYQTRNRKEYPTTPDVMVVKGIELTEAEISDLKSWQLYLPNRPAPNLVFEISSESTWKEDIANKPATYAKMGAKEYFAHDPVGYWKDEKTDLKGWRNSNGTATKITPNDKGWLWSEELDAWLVSEGDYLRLYDKKDKRILTQVENEQTARQKTEKQMAELLEKLNKRGIDPDKL